MQRGSTADGAGRDTRAGGIGTLISADHARLWRRSSPIAAAADGRLWSTRWRRPRPDMTLRSNRARLAAIETAVPTAGIGDAQRQA